MLTGKQASFANLVANGASQSEAYRQAYNAANMGADSVHVEACRVAAIPRVSLRIAEHRASLQAAIVAETIWDRRQLLLEAETNLHGSRKANQWGPATSNLKLIAEITGQLAPTVAISVHVAPVSIEELEERMERLDVLESGLLATGLRIAVPIVDDLEA